MTYQSVLVAGLLPFLGHGLRLGLSEQVDEVEDSHGDGGELGDLDEDLKALSLGSLSARAVRTEGNPVG